MPCIIIHLWLFCLQDDGKMYKFKNVSVDGMEACTYYIRDSVVCCDNEYVWQQETRETPQTPEQITLCMKCDRAIV